MGFAPTPEQYAVISSTGRIVKVTAFAGAGKTSTLRLLAAAHSDKRILYIAFNRSVAMEASRKFPSNTTVTTGHALAWKGFGEGFGERLANDIKPVDLASMGLIERPASLFKDSDFLVFCDGVLKVLNHFLHSPAMSFEDLDMLTVRSYVLSSGHLVHARSYEYVEHAESLWRKMIAEGSKVPVTHDVYMKLFQLSRPVFRGFDILLLDEAQDTNGVLLDIVLRQDHMRIFFIGDSRQSIYAFRGAVDALEKVPADEHLYLTSSFRFGQDLADMANALLSNYAGETHAIRGLGGPTTVRFTQGKSYLLRRGHAYICRSNAGVFKRASMATKAGLQVGFVGGIGGYKLDFILATWFFLATKKTRHPFLSQFKTFKEMEKYARDIKDRDLLCTIGLVKASNSKIPEYVKKLKALGKTPGQVMRSGENHILVTTAHKSKGLEFDHGEVCEDFPDLSFQQMGADQQEVNLMYVAMTRMRKTAYLHEPVFETLRATGKVRQAA